MINLSKLIRKPEAYLQLSNNLPHRIGRLTLKEKVSLRWRRHTDVSQQTLRFDLVLAEDFNCLEDHVSSLYEIKSDK